MNTFSHVPPGFRFHPTDEELVDYYLRKKVNLRRIDLNVIKDVDLYKIEPWDLQEICQIGTEEQNEWYFFSHKDKKYPTGTRTNRATAAGFWKATGRDKAIYSKQDLIGMRKTLVFYKGRAPNGQKSDWIMHEYRLETDENGTPQEEGWVVCRVFKKRITTTRKVSENESTCWYDDQDPFMHDLDSPKQNSHHPDLAYDHHQLSYSCKKELDHQLQCQLPSHHHHHHFLQLPLLQSCSTTSVSAYGVLDIKQASTSTLQSSTLTQEQTHDDDHHHHQSSFHYNNGNTNNEQAVDDQVLTTTDWRVLDKFVASQLSQEEVPKDQNNHSNGAPNNIFNTSVETNILVRHLNKQEPMPENTSISISSSEIDLWK